MAKWFSFPCSRKELSLSATLPCGQSFRWKEIKPGIWRSVLSGKIWTLKQTDSELFYRVHTASENKGTGETVERGKSKDISGKSDDLDKKQLERLEHILKDYFQLGVSLSNLYARWSEVDKNFAKCGQSFPGVRVLRQDPVENVFSFICSSNNNISRISGMVNKLCVKYGSCVGTVDGEKWYSFPEISRLAGKDTEEELRSMGFGYRAKYIHQTALLLSEYSADWLHNLRGLPYQEAHAALQKLPGIGAKVADCVCLFSLDQPGAIPVDTHVWQIACRDYMPELKTRKSLTDKTYRDIGDFFRNLFGDYAGWAHSVLFTADLGKPQTKLTGGRAGPTGDDGLTPTKRKKRKRQERT